MDVWILDWRSTILMIQFDNIMMVGKLELEFVHVIDVGAAYVVGMVWQTSIVLLLRGIILLGVDQ